MIGRTNEVSVSRVKKQSKIVPSPVLSVIFSSLVSAHRRHPHRHRNRHHRRLDHLLLHHHRLLHRRRRSRRLRHCHRRRRKTLPHLRSILLDRHHRLPLRHHRPRLSSFWFSLRVFSYLSFSWTLARRLLPHHPLLLRHPPPHPPQLSPDPPPTPLPLACASRLLKQ